MPLNLSFPVTVTGVDEVTNSVNVSGASTQTVSATTPAGTQILSIWGSLVAFDSDGVTLLNVLPVHLSFSDGRSVHGGPIAGTVSATGIVPDDSRTYQLSVSAVVMSPTI